MGDRSADSRPNPEHDGSDGEPASVAPARRKGLRSTAGPRVTSTPATIAGTDETTSAEALARQRVLWQEIITARYAALALIGLACLLPQVGPHRFIVAGGLFFVAIPYNAVYDWLLRRNGILYPTLAYSDQVLAVAFVAVAPDLLVSALLFMLAIAANTAVAFSRRVAFQSTFVGFIGLCLAVAIQSPVNPVPALTTYGVLAGFTAFTVGAISEDERRLRRRYAELMSGIDAIVWEQLSSHPSTLYVNEEAQHVLGYPAADWAQPGMWSRVVHPDDRLEVRRLYREAIRRAESRELEYRMITADGRTLWVQDRMRIEIDANGRPAHVRGVMVDVSATRVAQEQANLFVDLVDGIKLALFVFGLDDIGDDETLTVRALNPEAAHLAGVKVDDAVGHRFHDVLDLTGQESLSAKLADVVRTGEGFAVDELRMGPGGRGGRVYSAFAFPLPGDAAGLSLHDITERTMAGEVLRRQALHDGLTGLPNRTLLHERLRHALVVSAKTGEPVSLLVLDLDSFKDVNDALGHDQGDRLLIETSRRLQRVLRKADTIARLGGDEFAVLITQDADGDGAEAMARQIRAALEQPIQLGGISLQTSASVGIATFPDHGDDAESLAQRADVAMYAAKRTGVGIGVYSPDNDQSSVRRLALLGELRGAISDDELVLFYQPSLDLDTGDVHSAEALVRWRHPTHGLMPPAEFIELAEVSGLIHPMTRWIIGSALDQIRAWLDDGIELKIGVNLSVRNLYDRELVPWLSDLLRDRGVPASLLKLEVTESELMDDPLLALEVLGKLRALGCSTSIDDFGTGYSSLAYLKHLPIDELKIDKSFVGNLVNDPSDLTIVRSTIDLSHNLGMSVVAEGVEDGPTLRRLAELGCDRAQGYFVSRPVAAEVFTAWLTDPTRRVDVVAFLPGGDGSIDPSDPRDPSDPVILPKP